MFRLLRDEGTSTGRKQHETLTAPDPRAGHAQSNWDMEDGGGGVQKNRSCIIVANVH